MMEMGSDEPCAISVCYDGAILAALSAPSCRPMLRAFLSEKFNSIADILEDHDAELDMDTLSPVTFGANGTVPQNRQVDLAMALEPLEFTVTRRNGPA